jgi:CSLREA domain-containing protein
MGERVRSRRLSEVVVLALALATLVSVLVIFPSRIASAALTSEADYRFQNKRSSSVANAPALQDIGSRDNSFTSATVDGTSRKVLKFPKGNGLKLPDTTRVVPNNNTYTIVVLFELNDVSNFRRVVDFKNGTSDNGLYVQNGRLRFFPGSSGPTPIVANKYVQVVITRDGSGLVRGYVDGSPQFEFNDATSQDAVISAKNTLRFFKDNTSGGTTGEDSAGSVARIRLYDVALSDSDVKKLDRLEPTIFTVNSTADLVDSNNFDGKCLTGIQNQCTLRAAIQQANWTLGGDTINFSSAVTDTITLDGELIISDDPDSDKDVTINGPKPKPGARILTVSGNNASRVFRIVDDASAAINNLKISNGNATATNGGGIYNDGDLLALTNSTVSGNNASSAGGGIYNTGNVLTLNKTTVSGNTSDGSGGILNSSTSTLKLTNSTVSGNNVTFNGGGIYNNGGTMTLINSTVSKNTAEGGGGGLNNGGTAILRNTIVAGNTAGTNPDAGGTYSTEGKNLIGDTSGFVFTGSGVLSGNPRLGPLQDNGGPTDTHALLSGSQAIDRGSSTGCPSTDQRGVSRPRDGDGNGKASCDIGSYEKK